MLIAKKKIMNRLLQICTPLAMVMLATGIMLGPIGFTAGPDAGGEVTRQLVEWRWFIALDGVVGLALLLAFKRSLQAQRPVARSPISKQITHG